MNSSVSRSGFDELVMATCHADREFRHEIERYQDFGSYGEIAEIAYRHFCLHFLSMRECFGMTSRS